MRKNTTRCSTYLSNVCGITKTYQNRISGRHAGISKEDAAFFSFANDVFLTKREMRRLLSHVEAKKTLMVLNGKVFKMWEVLR